MGRNQRDEPPIAHIANPAACASMTGTDIDPSAMNDGSANNTLGAIGNTSTGNESDNIELNFDKIADEINALNDDCGALKTAVDANNTAIDSILVALETIKATLDA